MAADRDHLQGNMRWLSLSVIASLLLVLQSLNPSPVGKGRKIPKAPPEAIEPLKRAYAAWKQGHYEQAIQIAKAVYERYGEVYAVWWSTWARRIYGQLPVDVSLKNKRVRYVFLGEKWKLYPGLTQARDLLGKQDFLAYAPYEENPFTGWRSRQG